MIELLSRRRVRRLTILDERVPALRVRVAHEDVVVEGAPFRLADLVEHERALIDGVHDLRADQDVLVDEERRDTERVVDAESRRVAQVRGPEERNHDIRAARHAPYAARLSEVLLVLLEAPAG